MNRYVILAVLVVANVVTALLVVRDRHEHRLAFIALNKLDKARDELNIEFGRLQLEQATWAESNRVDQVARTRLGMVFPRTEDIVVLRRGNCLACSCPICRSAACATRCGAMSRARRPLAVCAGAQASTCAIGCCWSAARWR